VVLFDSFLMEMGENGLRKAVVSEKRCNFASAFDD
jgi:3-methyladenine DNA glycosylase Tag